MPLLRFRRGALPSLVAVLGLFFWISIQEGPRAQEPKSPVFAIIDIQKILRESTAVKALSKRIEAQKAQYQAELRVAEQTLREADQELARQRSILSAEAYAKKRIELEKKVATLQREARKRKRGLDREFANGMSAVQRELAKVAKEIAEARGLDLILSKASVVIVKPKFELTEEAVQRLNARLPDVPPAQTQN
jgi:Skp family chaperone for outer membrane proteins